VSGIEASKYKAKEREATLNGCKSENTRWKNIVAVERHENTGGQFPPYAQSPLKSGVRIRRDVDPSNDTTL
jgi:hypothetical protein